MAAAVALKHLWENNNESPSLAALFGSEGQDEKRKGELQALVEAEEQELFFTGTEAYGGAGGFF